jgi:hypothetical protein
MLRLEYNLLINLKSYLGRFTTSRPRASWQDADKGDGRGYFKVVKYDPNP